MSLQTFDDYFNYLTSPEIEYKYVSNEQIKRLLEEMTSLRKQISRENIEDELIVDTFDLYRGYMFECISCLVNYDELGWDINKIRVQLQRIKNRFPSYFNIFLSVGRILKAINQMESNDLFDELRKVIGQNPNKKIAIVTKRNLPLSSKERIKRLFVTRTVKKELNFFNNNAFRTTGGKFDLTIFLGNERAYEGYANNCFKSPKMIFLSYNAFYNGYTYKGILNKMEAHSTIFRHTTESKGLTNQYFEQDEVVYEMSLNEARIQKYIQGMYDRESNQEAREVKIVTAHLVLLEGEKGILLNQDKEYQVINLEESGELEKKKVEEIQLDEYIIVNNKSDIKLKYEMALKELGEQSEEQERNIWLWKERIIKLVEEEGIEEVSKILRYKGIKASNPINIKYWMSDYSILPEENYILDILGFNKEEKNRIICAAKLMKAARIRAGRYILNQLRAAISKLNLDLLIEEGHQSFEVEELKGASFSIERIIGFGKGQYEVASNKTGQTFKIKELN